MKPNPGAGRRQRAGRRERTRCARPYSNWSGDAVVLSGISVTGNRFDHYTISDEWGPLLFAGSGFAPQRNVTFSNNTVVGQPMRLLIQPNGYSRSYFTFAGNKSDTPAAGPLIWASGCDHLTVTGNVQPLTSGVLTDLRC